MASSESKAKPESDVTPAGEETLDFDDDTSKGQNSCYFFYQKSLLDRKTALLYVYALYCWQNVLTAILQSLSRNSKASTIQFTLHQHNLSILIKNIRLDFPVSMTSSENNAKPESDVTPAGEETLHFDDDTPKGEDSCYYRNRSRC